MASVPAINIVHLSINDHAAVFDELIELLSGGLRALGVRVRVSRNVASLSELNLYVGQTVFLHPDEYAAFLRRTPRCIVFQTEALDVDAGFTTERAGYIDFLRQVPYVWDYSHANIAFLSRIGRADAHYIPLGYSPSLERIAPAPVHDIDAMFYGAMNPRRRKILSELEAAGVRVCTAYGVYGSPRDQLIARSKIILNLHQFDMSHLEQVRLSYLLNNRCFVISEPAETNPYGNGVVYAEPGRFVESCRAYLAPEAEVTRRQIADQGYDNLRAIPFLQRLQSALGGIKN